MRWTVAPLATALLVVALPATAEWRELAPELKADGVPDVPEALKARLTQYQNTRSASFQDWIGGGPELIVSTRFAETSQLHRMDHPRGARHQLTFEDEPLKDALWATWRGRDGFFYLKDEGGAEAYQIWFFDMKAATHTMVTDGKSRNVGMALSNGGLRLAFSSTARNSKDFDVYVLDLAQERPKRVLSVVGFWHAVDWSPDDTELLVRHYVSSTESTLHRVEVLTGESRPLVPETRDVLAFGSACYAKDGKSVYFVSNLWGEFLQLSVVDLASHTVEPLTAGVPWDVESIERSRDGKLLAWSTNEGGVSRLHLSALPRFKPMKVPELPVGQITGMTFDAAGKQLAMTIRTASGPSDVYVLDVKKRKLARWTESEVGGLDAAAFVVPELIEYPTFDKVGDAQRTIPAFYYKPAGDGPHPVVVLIHGGPESQYRPRFSAFVQYWVIERGIAVIAPNVRGSAGYGKSYLLLDNGALREDSVKDIGALLDWIGQRAELDVQKVGVFGGSYGGYMVLATMAKYPEQVRAGAEIVGISNFVTFLKNTKDYRRDLRRAEYGDERDPQMHDHLQKISPTNLSSNIRAPLFVAQGANDPRVPATESEQIVREVRKQGSDVWYMLAEDEGHGFRKKKNRDWYLSAMTLFWDRYLVGNKPGSAGPGSPR